MRHSRGNFVKWDGHLTGNDLALFKPLFIPVGDYYSLSIFFEPSHSLCYACRLSEREGAHCS